MAIPVWHVQHVSNYELILDPESSWSVLDIIITEIMQSIPGRRILRVLADRIRKQLDEAGHIKIAGRILPLVASGAIVNPACSSSHSTCLQT